MLVEKKSINESTAIIAPAFKQATGSCQDIFSSVCKHCSANVQVLNNQKSLA